MVPTVAVALLCAWWRLPLSASSTRLVHGGAQLQLHLVNDTGGRGLDEAELQGFRVSVGLHTDLRALGKPMVLVSWMPGMVGVVQEVRKHPSHQTE